MSIQFKKPGRGRPLGSTFEPREKAVLEKIEEVTQSSTHGLKDAARLFWQEAAFQSRNEDSVCRRLCRRCLERLRNRGSSLVPR
jgi:hypothetical protein